MSETSKEKIIRAATETFAEKGFEGASVREIASKADVNIASINYHFQSKQKLIDFLVENFVDTKFAPALKALDPPKTREELKLRLKLFIEQYLNLVLEDYESFLMMQKNMDFLIRQSPKTFRRSFEKVHFRFLNFTKGALENSLFPQNLDPDIVSQIIFGCFFDLVKTNHVRKSFGIQFIKDKNFIEAYTNTYLTILFNEPEVNH